MENLQKKYVQRDQRLFDVDKPIAKVIIGPRRAGKSWLAMHEIAKFPKFGYINFDDEILHGVEDIQLLFESAKKIYGRPDIWLLDEIQNLPNWELVVNRLQRQNNNLIITGSNSKLLSRELSTHLTGRHVASVVFPFSFNEYLKAVGGPSTEAEIQSHFARYVRSGGFPEPLMKELDYKSYITSLFDSLLIRDIMMRHRLKSAKALQDLAAYLVSNIGNSLSYSNLAKLTDVRSVHTVIKYLVFLEEAFLFFTVNAYSPKVKDQIRSPKKIYIVDNGFHQAKAFALSPNFGKLYENLTAIALKKRQLRGELEFYYYKNAQNYEVDFIVKTGTKIDQLIQVCFDPADEKTKKREIRALLRISDELQCRTLLVLTENCEKEETVEWFGLKGKILYLPLWKWLKSTD